MKRKELNRLRNIGIMAHIDAGKTTVTENFLYLSGASRVLGSVDGGNTVTDHSKAERDRGITIQSAAVNFEWPHGGIDYGINLIDTPGHIDFNGEVERSLRVLDGVLALFCGVAGVEAQSRTVWAQADKFGLARIAFINKLDRPGADFGRVVEQVRETFATNAVALQLPWYEGDRFCGVIDLVHERALYWAPDAREPEVRSLPVELLPEVAAATAQLLERLAESDDAFLAEYLDGAALASAESIEAALRRATIAGRIVPVLGGSGFRGIGLQPLLDAVALYLPAPDEAHFYEEGGHFSGLIFKTLSDRYAGRLGFIRLRSGSLKAGDHVLCPRTGSVERIARVVRLQGAQRIEVAEAFAGDIVAVTGFKEMVSGDTLSDPAHPVVLQAIDFPAPVMDLAVELSASGQETRLALALAQLTAEDPALKYRTDAETGQLLLSGQGELHLEVVVDRLRDEFGLQVRTGRPSVALRSTIGATVRHRERLKKQSGGPGQFAEMVIEVSPIEGGTGFRLVNEVVGGAIPAAFVPAIEKGLRRAMAQGLDDEHLLDGVAVRLLDGAIHAQDSDATAFELCAFNALRNACRAASPVMLEPVMRVEVTVPSAHAGAVVGDLNRRRGRMQAMAAVQLGQEIKAEVPLMELFGYVASLRNISSGTGSCTMQFARYAAAPQVGATVA